MGFIFGADTGIRTRDLVLTKDVLYLLSHISKRTNSRQRYLLYLIPSYFATVFRSVLKFILENRCSPLILRRKSRYREEMRLGQTKRSAFRADLFSSDYFLTDGSSISLSPHSR